VTGVRDAFHAMASSCGRMGSPFMHSLLPGLADRLTDTSPVGAKVLEWPGDPTGMADALPLRLAGGLHALVLTGQDGALAAAYAAAGAGRPARNTLLPAASGLALAEAALAALARNEAFLLRWLDSAPQTNEVRRSIAMIATGHWLTARYGLPLVLSELGASAGLNLLWDHYALAVGDQRFGPDDATLKLEPAWQGPPPPLAHPAIRARAGVDLNPLDPVTDRLRLLAYLWPDQPDRLIRTVQALDLAELLRPEMVKGDAIDWLNARLQTRHPGAVHVVFHTVAWQYFPAAAQDRGRALLATAGAMATPDAPLVHLAMEADDASPGDGAGLTMTLWPGGQPIAMARVDFHGRWLRWTAPPP
jgi:hypothetical protein